MHKNNWIVITGAPSSGKTTVLRKLEEKGYKVYEEWARVYIDSEMKKGKSIEEIRNDEFEFQKKILQLKIDFEKTLHSASTVFLDRGIPDSLAYAKMYGFKFDKDLEKALKKCTYKKVFFMELLEYATDYARTESQEQAILLHENLENTYLDLGMNVIKVPKMSVLERAEFILNNL